MQFVDAVTVSGVRRTSDGYLVAEARAVREGIQHYAGSEVGFVDQDVVRVYRPRDEVFAQDSLQSFSHAPITIDHPTTPVSAENWRDLAVGEVSTAAKSDGEWVMLPLILKDAAAISAVEGGKCELSAGYTCELEPTSGKTPDGQTYDAIQRGIKINHLAIVDRARAGSKARIGDGAVNWGAAPTTLSDTKEDNMSDALKTVVLGDKAAQVAVSDAQIIEQFKADSAKALADAEKAHEKAIAAKDADIAKLEAERDDAKAKVLSDEAIEELVAGRVSLIADAKSIAPDAEIKGKSEADIRKAVVVAKLGDAVVTGKSDDYIAARFDILAEDAKADPVKKAFTGKTVEATDANTAYDENVTDLSNAWKVAK